MPVRIRSATVTCLALTIAADALAQTKEENGMARIAGGTYTIGSPDGAPDTRPAHAVALEPFLIDRFEVTNAEFAAFLNTLDVEIVRDAPGGRVAPDDVRGPDAGRLFERGPAAHGEPYIALGDEQARIGLADRGFAPEPGYADHPVTETTWYGAQAFCLWRGAHLPSEAEWEAAARGRAGRTYPWGESLPSAERVWFGHSSGETAAVGTHPAGATPEGVQRYGR